MGEKKSGLKIIKREKLSEAVSVQVMELIKTESLSVGEKLPTEKELIQKLGVSRTAVREGMQRLAMLSIIDICPGQGTFICKNDKTSDLILNLLSLNNGLNKDSLLELLELRKILEVGIVGIASKKSNQKDLLKLENCVKQHKIDVEKNDFLSPQDAQFHNLIVSATHNKIIIDFFSGIFDLIKGSLLFTGDLRENRIEGVRFHSEILYALKKQDSSLAMKIMSGHIDWLISIIQKKKFK